jgi:hypothetical protein
MPEPYYKPAQRSRVGWLIAICGGAGSGKTYSALRLATGLVGPGGTIALADTDRGRATYYIEEFNFLHHVIDEPFRPERFEVAAIMAQKEGHSALIIDNFSYEHNGPGGVLDWHEEELLRLAGEDYQRREKMNQLAWVAPKMARKRMLQRFWQLNMHLILCLQAEKKTEQTKDERTGKMKLETVYQPVCGAELPYFMTASFLLEAKNPGVPLWPPLKLMGKHEPLFPKGKPLDEETGARLAAWARGQAAPAGERAKNLAAAEEIIARFNASTTRQDHLQIAEDPTIRNRINWFREKKPELFERINAALLESFARTAGTEGDGPPDEPQAESEAA